MSNMSRYNSQGNNRGPSDLQWLEDGINYLGAWASDICSIGRKTKESSTARSNSRRGKLSRRSKDGKLRKSRGKRKIIRIREREIEIYVED